MLLRANISVCRKLGEEIERNEVCLSQAEFAATVGVAAVVILANLLHMLFIFQLKRQRDNVFYIALWLTSISDILTSAICCLSAVCELRKLAVFQYTFLLPLITVLCGSTLQTKICMTLYTIVERWLILAKPLEYYNSIYVRCFGNWVGLAVGLCVTWNLSLCVIQYFYDNVLCFDVGFGFMSSVSYIKYIIAAPYALLCATVMVYGMFFLYEYLKMSKYRAKHERNMRKPSAHTKQACNYVLISTVIYIAAGGIGCLFEALALFSKPSMRSQLLSSSGLTLNQSFGLWNILALYISLRSYRSRVKHVLCYCRIVRRRQVSDGVVVPDITENSNI